MGVIATERGMKKGDSPAHEIYRCPATSKNEEHKRELYCFLQTGVPCYLANILALKEKLEKCPFCIKEAQNLRERHVSWRGDACLEEYVHKHIFHSVRNRVLQKLLLVYANLWFFESAVKTPIMIGAAVRCR